MITSIIHRIWLNEPDGARDEMPAEFHRYGHEWEQLHPDWAVWEWRERHLLPPLVQQDVFDRAREICPNDWKRFEADLLRLELLYRFGGVYVDTDVQPLKPIGSLLHDVEAFAAWSPNLAGGKPVLTNAVMGAQPGHPFIRACLDNIPNAVEQHASKPLAQMIGPYLIDRTFRQYTADAITAHYDGQSIPSVTAFAASLFYPQSNRNRDRGVPPNLSGAYAWHRWANTRDNRKGGVG